MQIKLEGFRELDAALTELTKAGGKGVLRRSLKKAAEPMAVIASGLAPVDSGKLQASVIVGAKLDGRQAKLHRRMFKDDRSSIELFVGPSYLRGGGGRHGHLQEFGTINHAPQPFMRPAWDQDHKPMLDRLGKEMAIEVDKAVQRARRKALKAT